jgi:hypothetical protein
MTSQKNALAAPSTHYVGNTLMWDLLAGPALPQLIYVLLFLCVAWLLLSKGLPGKPSLRSVAILVLGDVGRSPRMMYHAESFAKLHFETFLVGYEGTLSIRFLGNTFLNGQPAVRFYTGPFATLSPACPLSVSLATIVLSPKVPVCSVCAHQDHPTSADPYSTRSSGASLTHQSSYLCK